MKAGYLESWLRIGGAGLILAMSANTALAQVEQPASAVAKTSSEPPSSFLDGFRDQTKTNIGFSVGANESYASTGRSMTSLNPSLFLSTRKAHADIWLNYAYGWRRDNETAARTGTHTATFEMTRKSSEKVTFSARNLLSSAVNDYADFPQFLFGTGLDSAPVQTVDVSRQRVIHNSVVLSARIEASQKTQFRLTGRHELWRYAETDLHNQGYTVDLEWSHQINRWMQFENGYSTHISATKIDPIATINRLQILGFNFQPGRGTVEIAFGGALEAPRYNGTQNFNTGGTGSISKTTGFSRSSLSYRYGAATTVGVAGFTIGHTGSMTHTQWISKRVQLQLASNYTRSKSLEGKRLDSWTNNAQLGVAIQSHLMLTASYWQLSQKSDLSFGTPRASRSNFEVGLQYYLPSLLR